jgi:hypothetical protein
MQEKTRAKNLCWMKVVEENSKCERNYLYNSKPEEK